MFTFTTYSLIQTKRDCIYTIGLNKLKGIIECKNLNTYCKFVCQYSIPFHQFQFYSCYQYYTTYIWHATVVFAQAALPKFSVYKCSLYSVHRSSAWCCSRNGQSVGGLAITCDGNRMQYSYIFSSVYLIHLKTTKSHNISTYTIKFNTLIYCLNNKD